MNHFATLDYVVFVIYLVCIIFIGLWVSRLKKGTERTAKDYFLANRLLPWWAIGSSLLAANISAEHFIAMSGSGYAIGLAIAAYEWVAAVVLLIVAKFFLPVFIKTGIYTMPEFLKRRYDQRVSSTLAVFWLFVYVFVNITSVSYLGALAMENILGIPLIYGIIGLSVFSAIYSLYGGLKAVAWTDVFQVVILVLGGLITTYLAVSALGSGEGFIAGAQRMIEQVPQKFHMIIEKGAMMIPDGEGGTKDAFKDLPGLAVIIGSMWLTNICFWGFNQYIIQRGLAAKSTAEAQLGLAFAGFLKLLVPLLVVIPGIAAFALGANLNKSDEAYPWLLNNIVPPGITGLAFAAIVAAVVSSLSSLINSTSTIFTMDIYKTYIKKDASDKQLVMVGRIVAFVALALATSVAPQLRSLDQAYQYVQEYTGFIYPGVFLIFFLGLFWKKATSRAALWTALLTIPLGIVFKFYTPDMPFIVRIGYVFIILTIIMVGVSLTDKKSNESVAMMGQGKIRNQEILRGSLLIFFAALVGIAASLYVREYEYLALDSVYVLVTGFGLLGFVLISNAICTTMNKSAIIESKGIMHTDIRFNIASAALVISLCTLYYIFW